MNFEPHQQRMIDERKELSAKVLALHKFFITSTFNNLDSDEKCLLRMQSAAMMQYQIILNMRISKFDQPVFPV